MAIQIGGTTVIDNSRNINAGIGTFTNIIVPPAPITFSPAIGSTSVGLNSNIIITFNQSLRIGTGNITLRNSSGIGTVIQTIGVSSSSVSITNNQVTINPPINMPSNVNVYVVVDAGAFIGITTSSVTAKIDTYQFTSELFQPGVAYEGGYLMCMASPVRWIVSPYCAEVTRGYGGGFGPYTDAALRAQQVSGCTGWFVPCLALMQNPGYVCKAYWGPSPCWSVNTDYYVSECNCTFNMTTGASGVRVYVHHQLCVRAFRCVTY